MTAPDGDRLFAGSIPALYERLLVPLIFEPYAVDIAVRTAGRRLSRVLEMAAGTGVATRQLAEALPPEVEIVATDLSAPMLDKAQATGTWRPVTWRQADAMHLPFADGQFDAVVCQFGVMFFPDKARAFAEARRVLRPGGRLIFNVWDRIERNGLAETVTRTLADALPDDPPRFLARLPHGYHDLAVIARDLQIGGFVQAPECTTLAARSRAASAHDAAFAYCQGTPLRGELEARAPERLDELTALAAAAFATRHGDGRTDGPVDAPIQAHVVEVER